MANKNCPVCQLQQQKETSNCLRCGWDFSPILGSPDQMETLLRKRLDQARTAWRQRQYNPDLIPELERDPFETSEEFAARLAERPWYVGEGEQRKAEYNLETGHFPLAIQAPGHWSTPWIDSANSFCLRLPRDLARALYQRGTTWPMYAHLAVQRSHVSLASLVLLGAEGELPVEIRVTETAREDTRIATVPLISRCSEIDRDPFETAQEFAQRLAERPWYVGEGELQKAGYDIRSGRFPLRLKSMQSWAKRWVTPTDEFRVVLPRESARALFQRSAIWPLYAHLVAHEGQATLVSMVLMAPDEELPVESSLINGRYLDLGNGTVVDTQTGLQWMRCALGQHWDGHTCIGQGARFDWNDMFKQVEIFNHNSGFACHKDWRVPSKEEFVTLIKKNCKPAIDQLVFPNIPVGISWEQTGHFSSSSPHADYASFALALIIKNCKTAKYKQVFPNTPVGSSWEQTGDFWSSTPYADYASYAWGIYFCNGGLYYNNKNYLSYVRLVRCQN